MDELPYMLDLEAFKQELYKLHLLRKNGKLSLKRMYRLSRKQRQIIHAKTAGRCHVCGGEVTQENFEADHVLSHSSGGGSTVDNFLPACRTCNNYRWHYLSEEFRWILKLGVWARSEIANGTRLGDSMGAFFIKREKVREKRRKSSREAKE